MKILYNVILIGYFFCNYSTNLTINNTEQKEIKIETANRAVNNSIEQYPNSDTLIVTKKSAVFFFQNSKEIEKRKRKTNEEDFYVTADDAMYYLSIAREFIDTAKLLTFEQNDKKFIKFVKLDKTYTLIKVSKLEQLCGIYFFDPKKQPKQIDIINVSEEFKQYFGK